MNSRGGEVREPREVQAMLKECVGHEWWKVLLSIVVSALVAGGDEGIAVVAVVTFMVWS
jgi:hypothetical protein